MFAMCYRLTFQYKTCKTSIQIVMLVNLIELLDIVSIFATENFSLKHFKS